MKKIKGKGVASHELLREVCKPQGIKHVAAGIGRSHSLVSKWTEPTGENASGTVNPLEYIARLWLVTGDRRLAHWVCEQCGGYFVPNPPAQPLTGTELLPATSGVMQELGLLQAVVAEAVKDCQVSLAEAVELRQKWEVLKSDMEAYLRAGEGNHFNPLPARATVKATMEARN